MPKKIRKKSETNEKSHRINRSWCHPWLHFWRCGGFGGRLETSCASLMLCNLTRSPPWRGAADVFGSKNDPWTFQGRLIWWFCFISVILSISTTPLVYSKPFSRACARTDTGHRSIKCKMRMGQHPISMILSMTREQNRSKNSFCEYSRWILILNL